MRAEGEMRLIVAAGLLRVHEDCHVVRGSRVCSDGWLFGRRGACVRKGEGGNGSRLGGEHN